MSSGEESMKVLKLSSCRRCATCFRIFTPRRMLLEKWCRCGGGTMKAVGALLERDLPIIQEDYGYDVEIQVQYRGSVEDGLLPKGGLEPSQWEEGWEIGDARLLSRQVRERTRDNERKHRIIGLKRWWETLPRFLRSRRSYQDVLAKTRRRAARSWP